MVPGGPQGCVLYELNVCTELICVCACRCVKESPNGSDVQPGCRTDIVRMVCVCVCGFGRPGNRTVVFTTGKPVPAQNNE